MTYAPEALEAFVTAAELGSFSAAARRLGKSQSTISMAIANLELDLGFELFSRHGRYPVLTDAGQRTLGYAADILAAADRMLAFSTRMADQVEPRLTVGLTDSYPGGGMNKILHGFAAKFPDIELEWLDAEDADVIALLTSGRAHIGLLIAQSRYPAELITQRIPTKVEVSIFVARTHPLANVPDLRPHHLTPYRQIYLNTERHNRRPPGARVWSATDYFMVLEMAELGFGWASLPRALVSHYGGGNLVELDLPQQQDQLRLDIAWSKDNPPGPAGLWFADAIIKQDDPA